MSGNGLASCKVVVAGHVCLDITPSFPGDEQSDISSVLRPGKLINVGASTVSTGGAVANTGLAMRLFGADVRLSARVGADAFGSLVRERLKESGADVQLTEDPDAGTSYSIVIAVPGNDRIFLHDPGANDTFTASDVTDNLLNGAGHFHFGYPPLMRRMYEDGGRELVALFRSVKAHGLTTSLDMAAIDPQSPAGHADWKEILRALLPYVDVFLPSAEELCFMLDRPRYEEWNRRAGNSDVMRRLNPGTDIRPLAGQLMEMGASAILIKCGAPGMYYQTADKLKMTPLLKRHHLQAEDWCGKSGFEASYYQPDVVSGTGAGDTCIAAFLTAMTQGQGLDISVKLAAAAGACCISAPDALSGLEPLETMRKRIEQGWAKEVPL